jgi:hypothetical protein
VQTRTSAETRAKLRLDLYPIKRNDAVTQVNFAVTETGNSRETDTTFQVSQTFSDGDSSAVTRPASRWTASR